MSTFVKLVYRDKKQNQPTSITIWLKFYVKNVYYYINKKDFLFKHLKMLFENKTLILLSLK